jgi:hypothetical protein
VIEIKVLVKLAGQVGPGLNIGILTSSNMMFPPSWLLGGFTMVEEEWLSSHPLAKMLERVKERLGFLEKVSRGERTHVLLRVYASLHKGHKAFSISNQSI